jgi:Hpt domain
MQTLPLYDLTMVKGMVNGNYDAMRQLVRIFLDTVPKTLAELQTTAQKADWEAASKLAHKLKSTINTMNIYVIKEDVKTIEYNGRNNFNTVVIPDLVNKVDEVMKQVIGQMICDYDAVA